MIFTIFVNKNKLYDLLSIKIQSKVDDNKLLLIKINATVMKIGN